MSSSNLVRIAVIEEAVLGTTPIAGNFSTVRFISESLSGTPETTTSQQIRTDRLSSGMVVTGLTVEGDLNFELAKDDVTEMFMEGAMMNNWVTSVAVTDDIEINISGLVTLDTANTTLLNVGDFLTFTGFTNAENNVKVQITEIVNATSFKVTSKEAFVNETGTANTYKVADKLTIGSKKISYSMEKKFLDLSNKAINYRGQMIGGMSLNVNYGEILNGVFSTNGTDYKAVELAADMMTNTRTVDAPDTTQSMNGSIDMPWLITDSGGTLNKVNFCIQSLSLNLNNNLSAQNCIGKAAPIDYTLGTAEVEMSMSTYLSDVNWNILGKKLSQEAFSLGFLVENIDGAYGFFFPAIQVSFSDPASAGANQDISLDMSGAAKVGPNGESSLVLYRF